MKSLKKSILCILFAMVLVFSVFALMGFTTSTVNASTKDIFTAEDYTSNDRLLKEDGSLSTKEIVDFSNEVKVASNGVSFPELTQVIPSQILENSQETVSQYYGKEYGYYVVKEGDYVDVLLLDFEYEFDDGEEHSNEYIIKIKPLLQQRFLKFYNEGQYHWLKEKNFYKYYVANPRFFISLQNENFLNYGDSSYTKADDKGAAIVQTRLNYGRVSYKDEEDFINEGLKIAGKKLLDYTIKKISKKFPLVGVIKDAISNNLDIYKQGLEQIVIADNEDNIISLPGINNQKTDSQYLSYSRTAAFLPEDEIILSADENSYADYIVRIDEPDGGSCISRLDQICEFDIVRRNGNYSSMEHVAGNWYDENAQSLQFSKQSILFEDREPEFEVAENNIEGADIPVYLLPNGKQVIEFEPEYSAYYKFDLKNPDGLNLSVIDSDGNMVKNNGYYDLQYGEKYNIVITSGDEKVITSLAAGLADGKTSGTICANEKRLVKLGISHSEVYNISANNENCIIEDILIKTNNGLVSYSEYRDYTPYSTVSVPLREGEYYVLVYNPSAVNSPFNLGAEECAAGEVGETNTVNTDGINYVYIKFEIDTGNYTCTIPDAQNYIVLDNDMESIGLLRYSNGNFEFENSGDIIYIGILADEGEIDVYLSLSEYSYIWKVNGNVVDSNGVELERGNSYTIEFYINGIEQGNDFISYIDKDDKELAEGINFSGNQLTLMDYCPTGRSFEIKYSLSASAESKSGLTITPKYTVTFNGIESVTNDEKLTFNWKQTGDLAAIYYTLSNGTVTRSGSIDAAGNISGKIYSEDLTKFSSAFGISYATISIDKIGVTTSKGIDTLNLKTPFTATVHMVYGGGSGTKSNPFTISCNRHFYNLELNRNRNTYFQMTTNSININGEGIDVFYGYLNYSNFSDNWEVENDKYNITWSADVEVEGTIKENYGTIMNLHLTTRLTDGDRLSSYNAGGIVSENKGTGVIRCCSVELSVPKTVVYSGSIGGIAGINNGVIEYSWVASQVKTVGNYGGIASTNNGTIRYCETTGSIQQEITKSLDYFNNTCVGGIAAINNGTIQSCTVGTDFDSYLRINIVAEKIDNEQLAPYAGPVAGQNNGNISGCTADRYSIDTGNLHSWREWFHTYDQLKNINNII